MHVKIVHEKTVSSRKIPSGLFKCSECSANFSHRVSLVRHENSFKNSSSSNECDKCDKTFTRRDNLWKHRERVHGLHNTNIEAITKKKNNMCEICKKKFKINDELIFNILLRVW